MRSTTKYFYLYLSLTHYDYLKPFEDKKLSNH